MRTADLFFSDIEEILSSQATILKFGGTSLEDGMAFARVAQIVSSCNREYPVVVVSAMSGVTNALIASLHEAARGGVAKATSSLEEHFERHLTVGKSLGTNALARIQVLVEDSRHEIVELLQDTASRHGTAGHSQDLMASHGERLSANLLTIVLGEYGLWSSYVDARDCILTNRDHGNAEPLLTETSRRTRAKLSPILAAKKIPVLGGFIGATRSGLTTTMGRGASDYTATLVSAALKARETQIWTDVDGVQTADPALVASAQSVPQLLYTEAAELARLGARVMHPKMIQPVIEQSIPIRIRNSRTPERSGTLISAFEKSSTHTVKAIAHQINLSRIDIASARACIATGFLPSIERIFNHHRQPMQIVSFSESLVSFACEHGDADSHLVRDLSKIGAVKIKRDQAVISCVGQGLMGAPDNARRILAIVRSIDSNLSWRSTSDMNLMSIVSASSVGPLVRSLHEGIFKSHRLCRS